MQIKVGDRFHSRHYGGGIVVIYVSDDMWFFVLDANPGEIKRSRLKPWELDWVNSA